MKKLRLAIKKEEALQFLSHLDFARVVRLVIVRAKLPVCYSEGFNPHMKISFASALGVGVSAAVEYMDMELMEEIPVETVREAMNQTAPAGFAVLDGRYVDEKTAKLMAVANYAVYDLHGPVQGTVDGRRLEAILAQFNQAEEIFFEKMAVKTRRSRTINVKQHVVEPLSGTTDGHTLTIRAGILQTDEGAIKPVEVWKVLCEQFDLPAYGDRILACRIGIYTRQGECNYSLLDMGQ